MDVLAAVQNMKDQKKALTQQLQQEFPKLMATLFEKHQTLEKFGWTQYTPYFNDGDECVFGVNFRWGLSVLHIGGKSFGDGRQDEDRRELEEEPTAEESAAAKVIEKDITEFLKEVDEEFYKDLFGDHVLVLVTKDGATTEKYDHD